MRRAEGMSMIHVEGEALTLYAGRLPGRKRAALYIVRDNVVIPLAYFVSDEAEAEFWRVTGVKAAPRRAKEGPTE